MNPTTIREIREEAERRGRLGALKEVLQEHRGDSAAVIVPRLDLCTEPLLVQLTKLLGTTKPKAELVKAL